MPNIKNKFVVFIVCIIALIIGIQIFISPSAARDTNSYLSLVKGQCFLNAQTVEKGQRYILKQGDQIETKKESIAVIEWGDGSVTRISEDSIIKLKESMVFNDGSKIQIAFNLIQGKSWSKVTSLLIGDSFFKEYIDDIEAGVRGTEFEVNRDKQYISVKSHEVVLTDAKGGQWNIAQDQAFNLSTLTLIDIEKFVKDVQDKAWEQVNVQMNQEFFTSLKENFQILSKVNFKENFYSYFIPKYKALVAIKGQKDIEKVSSMVASLNIKDREFLLEKVRPIYQEVNFASVDSDVYKDKIYYRKVLFLLSNSDEDKKAITKSAVYDVKDILDGKNYTYLIETLSQLKDGKQYMNTLNINFEELFKSTPIIPDDVKTLIGQKIGDLKAILQVPELIDFTIPNISTEAVIQKGNEVLETQKSNLETIWGYLKGLFSN